jgi:serine protease Do/serine protease DegQ
MRFSQAWLVALAGFYLLLINSSPAQAALPVAINGKQLPSLAPVLERSTPAVVNIFTLTRVKVEENPLLSDPFFQRFFDIPQQPRQRETQNLGSGVIVDAKKGYILTNNHVIQKADVITVTLRDGRKLEARLVGTDPDTDVAVLQIPAEDLTALPLADSDALRVGDFVVAIGNPFGLGQTVTSGIVSALGRSGLGIEGYEDFIQTDASINPGNSGGALVNLRGELIGINTAIFSRSGGNIGIGFAIPINMAHDIMQQLVKHGEVQRGRLGAQAQDLTPDLARAFNLSQQHRGAVVVKVIPGSPADKAGLRVGDVVINVNQRQVRTAGDLHNYIGLLRVGTHVRLTVMRKGQQHMIDARIAKSAPQKKSTAALHDRLKGAVIGSLDEGHPAYGQIEGVIVLKVERGSPAAHAGLRPGDIITAINKKTVHDLDEAFALASQRKSIQLNIQRGRSSLFIVLR